MKVAALYIDPRGPYPKLPDVDCWDESRDATKYDGPWPLVAHPPCGPWGAFAHLCKRTNQAPGLALRAVEQVRKWGGVLEHPKHSRLWQAAGLPLPGTSDEFGGLTVEVDQLYWGHAAHKRTWLYTVRVDIGGLNPPPFPDKIPTHDLMGGRGRNAGADRSGLKEASQEIRRRTPPAFADALVALARSVPWPSASGLDGEASEA